MKRVQIPTRFEKKGNPYIGRVYLILMGVIIWKGWWLIQILFQGIFAGGPNFETVSRAGILLTACFMIYKFHKYIMTKSLYIAADLTLDSVSVFKKNVFGSHAWKEPVSSYKGVKITTKRKSDDEDSWTVYYISLKHKSDIKKDIIIERHESIKEYKWRKRAEDYAKLLQLGLLIGDDETLIDHQYLDKNILEKEKFNKTHNPNVAKIKNLTVIENGDITLLAYKEHITWWVWLVGIFIFLGSVWAIRPLIEIFARGEGLSRITLTLLYETVGPLGMCGIFYLFIKSIGTNAIKIDNNYITNGTVQNESIQSFKTMKYSNRVRLTEIEDIRIMKHSDSKAIKIFSDRASIICFSNWPEKELKIIREFLISKIKQRITN